ncbi:MAG: hypothetical protein H7Z74_13340 [Anaerolineae bacterium]|nr:hypothetical protein [Gemmatimonadaceae bacterium]
MTDMRIGPQGRDDDLTRCLRGIYARPSDTDYWTALEARIMAHLTDEVEGWWSPFRQWVRLGLVAAGVAGIAAGTVSVRSHNAQTGLAYRTVVETPVTLTAQIATQTGDQSSREATLQYLISP